MGKAAAAEREARFPIGAAATLEELDRDPHPLHARLRAAEPVSWLPALDGWLVTSRELALQAMRDAETFTVDDERFSTGQVVGPSMLTLDGAEHARHRGPFARPFRLDAVRERFTDAVRDETERLIEGLEPAGRAELRRGLAGPLAARIVTVALGLPDEDTGAVLGWYDRIVAAVTEVTEGKPVPASGARGVRRTARERGARVPGRRRRPDPRRGRLESRGPDVRRDRDDRGHDRERPHASPPEPGRAAAVEDDRSLLPNAIEESLRLEPAAAVIDRYATRDAELGGASIARGDLVRLSIAGANRDPAVFPDPDHFDVGRENARLQIAFAHGPHVCLGMHLARLEAHTAVGLVLERLPGLRLDPEEPPPAARGLVFRKPPALNVVWS